MDAKARKRDTYLRRTYGLSLSDYKTILDEQGGGCWICGKTPEQEGKSLAVDHDHKTRRARGILCSYCNKYLVGRHRDPTLLRKVADYLDREQYPFTAPEKKRKRRGKKVQTRRSSPKD